jgi:hypothetical protein
MMPQCSAWNINGNEFSWHRAQMHRQVRPWDKRLNADKNLFFEKQNKL